MPLLHVCPRSQVAAVLARSRAEWVVSVLAPAESLPDLGRVPPPQRLRVAVSDISEATPDFILAQRRHVEDLLLFLGRWNRATPLLVHCYAGVSRSTAVAFVALCALVPEIDEHVHARRLRASSPAATPNRHLVALADAVLDRRGRMIDAVAAIGRGAECFEGDVFALSVDHRPAPNGQAALDAAGPQPA